MLQLEIQDSQAESAMSWMILLEVMMLSEVGKDKGCRFVSE